MSEKSEFLKSNLYSTSEKYSEKTINRLNTIGANSNLNAEPLEIDDLTSLPIKSYKSSRLLVYQNPVHQNYSPQSRRESLHPLKFSENFRNQEEDPSNVGKGTSLVNKLNNFTCRSSKIVTKFPNFFRNDPSPVKATLKTATEKDVHRVSTPNFNKNAEVSVQDLKEICEKLAIEQAQMKEQINNQHKIIKTLKFPIKIVKNTEPEEMSQMNPRSRSLLKRGYNDISIIKDSESLKKVSRHKFPDLNVTSLGGSGKNSPRDLREDPDSSLPFMFCNKSELSIAKKMSSMKYYKDKPKLIKNSRFPKDIFVIKKTL